MTLCASIFRKMFETLSLYFEEDVLNAVFRFFRKMFETLSLYFEEDVLNAVFGF